MRYCTQDASDWSVRYVFMQIESGKLINGAKNYEVSRFRVWLVVGTG
jgi:hypothetical protein